MIVRRLQCIFAGFFLAIAASLLEAQLSPGSVAALQFKDVDGNQISTSEGNVTILTVITRENDEQGQAVADQMPEHCLGNPKYRYVTMVNFQKKIPGPLRGLTRTIIRSRIDREAKKLKAKYEARNIAQDPRKHIFVIADFDGAAVGQLGLSPDLAALAVFVFNGRGQLVQRWSEIPPGDSLARAIKAAE